MWHAQDGRAELELCVVAWHNRGRERQGVEYKGTKGQRPANSGGCITHRAHTLVLLGPFVGVWRGYVVAQLLAYNPHL